MRRSAPKLMLLLAAAASSFLFMTPMAAHAQQPTDPGPDTDSGATCIPHERDALLAFKQGITSDPAGILSLWQQQQPQEQPDGGHGGNDGDGEKQDCCRWRGVRCSGRTGHVVELRLGNANYYDTDDRDATALVGQISRSLLALEHLQHLDLSYNNLTDGRIPEFLGSLKNLQYLNLSGIGCHGSVPPHLGNLTQLQYLDLSSTSMGAASAYSTDVSWLAHLRFLRYLNLGSVNLSTVADWPHVIAKLPSLTVLRLPGCSLSGTLPEPVAQLTGLVALDLSRNSFTGRLPEFIGNLTGLRTLDLSSNKFTGPLPASVGYITGLRTLDVSYNNLTGLPREVGTLSSLTGLYVSHNSLDGVITEEHFGSLKSLQHIDLSSNFLRIEISTKWKPPFVRLRSANFADCKMGLLFPAWLQWLVSIEYLDISSAGINDRIPNWFPIVFSNARFLSMSKNQLSGELPTNMDNMSLLDELDLSNNSLTGQIPKLPQNLTYLDICINSLSGSLPADLGLRNLQVLSVASNSITGSIPRSICKSQRLRTLVLANNHLEGELPNCFGSNVMLFLDLSNNNLSGMLPASMQSCEMLQVLDLSRNMFSGRLPMWIGNLKKLRFLRLRQNMFSGNIPMNLTNLECLQYLDIADNGMSGSLPRNLSNLKSLKQEHPTEMCSDVFHVRVFAVNFSTFLKGQQLSYGSIPRIVGLNMKVIDLSFNNITGEIPEEIASLDGLLNLNLSKNHFSGNVPIKIGAMQSLESLDLSGNKLSGEIPASLSTLTFLSYLDLSYNNLTGAIPSGSQLDTLYAEHPYMYNGNIGLCGPPLKNNCLKTDASEQGPFTRTEKGRWLGFFYIGLGYGFLAGIWLVSCALLFMKNWRIAYFCLLDKFYDKTYVLVVTWWAKADNEDLQLSYSGVHE